MNGDADSGSEGKTGFQEAVAELERFREDGRRIMEAKGAGRFRSAGFGCSLSLMLGGLAVFGLSWLTVTYGWPAVIFDEPGSAIVAIYFGCFTAPVIFILELVNYLMTRSKVLTVKAKLADSGIVRELAEMNESIPSIYAHTPFLLRRQFLRKPRAEFREYVRLAWENLDWYVGERRTLLRWYWFGWLAVPLFWLAVGGASIALMEEYFRHFGRLIDESLGMIVISIWTVSLPALIVLVASHGLFLRGNFRAMLAYETLTRLDYEGETDEVES